MTARRHAGVMWSGDAASKALGMEADHETVLAEETPVFRAL